MTGDLRSRWLRILRLSGWWILLFVVFLLPYVQWRYWGHATTTAGLLALGYGRWKWQTTQRFGLPRSRAALVRTGIAFVLLYALFRVVATAWVGPGAGIDLHPWSLLYTATFACQALNEEIVLGALLLFGLERRLPHRVLLALVVSLIFAGLHYLMYRPWGLQHALLPTTLTTLFAVGVLRTGSILQARHVGYAWALHAGWNLVMFSGQWRETVSNRTLTEPQVFDALLGSPPLTLLSVLGASLLLIWMHRSPVPTRPTDAADEDSEEPVALAPPA